MISNINYEAQKDEVELLRNILFEKLNIISEEEEFVMEIYLKPDITDNPKLDFQINIQLSPDYPNVHPKIEVADLSNYLASSKIKSLMDNIHNLSEELMGMPMIYQIYEMVQTFANEQEDFINSEIQHKQMLDEEKKRLEKKKEEEELALLETKVYTPVTKDLFQEWFKKFYAGIVKTKSKTVIEQETRVSGREYFMNFKNKEIEGEEYDNDNKDETKAGESEQNTITAEDKIYFDAEAFCEDIDDIDFECEDA